MKHDGSVKYFFFTSVFSYLALSLLPIAKRLFEELFQKRYFANKSEYNSQIGLSQYKN